ncbi:42030_t:CDS:2, partial [Gigaspora margarita]
MSQDNIQQNCLVCLKIITLYRGVITNLKFKINNCSDQRYYKNLRVGVDKLCHECYIKIVDSYRHQMSTINRNIELDALIKTDLIENNNLAKDDTLTNLMEINNLIEISVSNILSNLIKTDNLIETKINNLIATNESTTFTNLTDTNNLINLIELIEAQKNELIKSNLIEINQQFTNIKINI